MTPMLIRDAPVAPTLDHRCRLAAVATVAVTALLINIFERKQEARNPFYRVVELNDTIDDPAIWGKNFPLQYDGYLRTVDKQRTRTAAARRCRTRRPRPIRASVVAQSRLEEDPRLKTMWAGYAFAVDFREERGHAYMLDDQTFTERQACQAAGDVPALPRLARDDLPEAGRRRPDQGLRALRTRCRIAEARKLREAPGGLHRLPRPGDDAAARHAPGVHGGHPRAEGVAGRRRTTTSTRWRRGRRCGRFVCGQCHVEYYFKGPKKRLTYPVGEGPARSKRSSPTTTSSKFKDWTHAGHRRAGAQGAASGVRDVEPGHPRALGRGVRRLPHALHAARAR